MKKYFFNIRIIFKKIIYIYFSFFLFFQIYPENNCIGTKFVVFGHIYEIIHDKTRMKLFIDKINDQYPEYIFILGDAGLEDKNNVEMYKSMLKGKVFFKERDFCSFIIIYLL